MSWLCILNVEVSVIVPGVCVVIDIGQWLYCQQAVPSTKHNDVCSNGSKFQGCTMTCSGDLKLNDLSQAQEHFACASTRLQAFAI